MVTDELREQKRRASLAAKQAQTDRLAELGAVPLRAAAAARGIHPDIAGEWAKRGLSTSAFRGPKRVWCVREQEFASELEHWRCSWADCQRYALNAARRCHEHAGAIERRGRLTADEFAAKHELNLGQLLARLQAGEIPADRVERGGRPAAWLIDEHTALQILDQHYRCQGDGCSRYALEPGSRYCAHCSRKRSQPVAAAAARQIWSDKDKFARWLRARHKKTRGGAFGKFGGAFGVRGAPRSQVDDAEGEIAPRVAALRAKGYGWRTIGREVGIDWQALRRWWLARSSTS